jgi:hypothetical protein
VVVEALVNVVLLEVRVLLDQYHMPLDVLGDLFLVQYELLQKEIKHSIGND